MKSKTRIWLVCLGWLIFPCAGTAEDTDSPEEPTYEVDATTEVHDLIQYFRDQRKDYLEARRLLRERLLNATEEERRAILQAFYAENHDRILRQRAMRKDYRRLQMDLRRLRRMQRQQGGDGG